MNPTRHEFRGAVANILAGQRARIDLVNGVRTFKIWATLRATVQVSVAPATNLRNMGSVAGLFTELGVLENGQEVWNTSGMEGRYLAEMVAPQPLTSSRAGVAIATYALEETVCIPFVLPWAASPEETPYLEANPSQKLEFFITLSAAVLSGALFTIGGATVAVTAISCEITQEYDTNRDRRALFIPTARISPLQITAAAPGGDTELSLRTSKYVRALVLFQNSDVGVVNDVVNRAAFRGDRRVIVGPETHPWRTLVAQNEFNFGGRVTGASGFGTAPTGSMAWPRNFQEGGRLSNILNPGFDTNWRYLLNAQVTAAAGATRSEVRLLILELEEKAGLTKARNFSI